MSTPLLIAMPGNEAMAAALARALDAEIGQIEMRQFPDGESYVRLLRDPGSRSVGMVCTLNEPNGKILGLIFAAATPANSEPRRSG